jgi:exosortase A-associated hydrolase 2
LLKGVFIDRGDARLFCAARVPSQPVTDAVMVVPAFGDEMNRTRRMLTETAKALNEARVAVLIPDLSGTGDSSGSFAGASWANWQSDLVAVAQWASSNGLRIRGLIAIRTGALLAAQFATLHAGWGCIGTTVFWQPVAQGRAFVRQLLRVRALASSIGSETRESVDELLARLINGETILAGGYPLTRAITEPLISIDLEGVVCEELGALHSIEVTRTPEKCGAFSEVLGGRPVAGTRYAGEPYWSATEIVCDMNVVRHTVRLLGVGAHAEVG